MALFAKDAAPLGQPYWWEDVVWPALDGALPRKVDLLVVGGGYTGLSAAIAAHDAGAKVAVIDAGRPGAAASSRNGGMVGAHPRLSWEALASANGAEVADAIFVESGAALDWMQALIAREGIDCDYETSGRIQLAFTAAHFEGQRVLASRVGEKSAVACRLIEGADLGAEIASPLYKGGLLFPEHGSLHPAKYYLGLLAAVLKRGVPVIGDCPAEALADLNGGKQVQTPRGMVRAERVLLATNGYTGRPFGWFMRRVFPLPSFLIATEPLSENMIGDLAPARRMMVETRARHSYFRVSPDGTRIIFGGRAAMVHVDLRTAAKRLHATMCEIWPSLKEVQITHAWSGNTGFAFGQMPVVGERDGVHYAMGFSGSGTVMAPYLGAKAAFQALGLPEGETAYTRTRLQTRWFHPGGAPHFLKGAEVWFKQWVDRRENSAAGR